MRRAPVTLWLLTIGVFVACMVLAFYLSGLAKHSKTSVVNVESEDPELEAAIESSRQSLQKFIKQLQNPPADVISFAVKDRIVQGKQAETLWVDHLTYEDGGFTGKLADVPVVVTGLHKGDDIKVPENQVVDWLIVHRTPKGDLQEGGETDRVLQKRQRNSLRYPRPMPTSTARSA